MPIDVDRGTHGSRKFSTPASLCQTSRHPATYSEQAFRYGSALPFIGLAWAVVHKGSPCLFFLDRPTKQSSQLDARPATR